VPKVACVCVPPRERERGGGGWGGGVGGGGGGGLHSRVVWGRQYTPFFLAKSRKVKV